MPAHRSPLLNLALVILVMILGAGTGTTSQAQSDSQTFHSFLPFLVLNNLSNSDGGGQEIGTEYPYSEWRTHQPPRWLGPAGGSVVALAVDPVDANIVYAGSSGAGVYKSLDGGENWVWAGRGITQGQIDSLAVDPIQHQTVYAGTHGGGIFKTTDGGLNWSAVNQGIQDNAVVYTLAVNPGNHDLVYAGTRGKVATSGPPWNGVLYKTVDGGQNWFPVLTNVGGSSAEDWVYSVRVNPYFPNIVLAATHEHGPYYTDTYGGWGEWYSTPGGAGDMAGRAIAFDPRSWTKRAYYATWHGAGVYRSSNYGQSWTSSNTGLDYAKVYPNGIAVVPNSPDMIYLATFGETTVRGVMKSDDAGQTWRQAGLGNEKIYSVAVPVEYSSVVFAGTYANSLWKSIDGGVTWAKKDHGLINTNVTQVVEGVNGILLASTFGKGVFRSTNDGRTWIPYNSGLADIDINGLVRHPTDPQTIFALTNISGLKKYVIGVSNGWVPTVTITASAPPIPPAENDPFLLKEPMDELLDPEPQAQSMNAGVSAPVLAMVFAPSTEAVAYLGTNGSGVYRSADSGSNWTAAGLSGFKVRSLAVSPKDANTVYAATNSVGLIKITKDGGKSWSNSSLPGLEIYSVTTSPARTDGSFDVFAGTNDGVWKFNGSSWTLWGLKGKTITAMGYNRVSPNTLLAGTTTGVYYKRGTAAWYALDDVLSLYTIQAISYSYLQPDFGYISTNARGVVRIKLPR